MSSAPDWAPPLAYREGRLSYRGRSFKSDPRALAIRSYNEVLAEAPVADWGGRPIRAVEVGTGAGHIITSVALDHGDGCFVGTDIDPVALSLARENAAEHGAQVSFVAGDLLAALIGPFDVIIANLPSNSPDAVVPEERWEPKVALYDYSGERAGLLFRFLAEVNRTLAASGVLYLEVRPELADLPGSTLTSYTGEMVGLRIERAELDAFLATR